ncbi:MAG: PAS domain S-box protein [Bacteroidia bacterium]
MMSSKKDYGNIDHEINRGLFQNSPNGISVVDIDSNTSVRVNNAKLKLLGYTKEEYLGLSPGLTLAEVQFDNVSREVYAESTTKEILEKGSFEGKIILKAKNGKRVYAEISSFLHKTHAGEKFIYSIVKDVSETILQNEILNEQNDLLNSIFEKSEVGIILYDNKQRKIVRLNKKYTDITGYEKGDILHLDGQLNTFPKFQIGGERTQDKLKKLREDLQKSGKVAHKTWHLKKDGSQFLGKFVTIRLPGAQDHLNLTLFEDITEEYRREREVEESEERFRRFAENSPNVIFKLELGESPRLAYVSPVVERVFGYSTSSLIDHYLNLQDFLVDPNVIDQFRHQLSSGAKFSNFICQIKKSNGRPLWCDVKVVPLYFNGKVKSLEGVITNIDKLKKSEQYLIEKSAELETKNKELEQFTYIASHDLRAPVVNMTTLLEMLEKESVGSFNNEIIDRIETTASKMYSTLHDLIDVIALDKRTTSAYEKLDIAELCNDIRSQLSEEIYNSKAIIEANYKVSKFKYVRVHLKSILQNLITNSIKYRSEERTLRINLTTEKHKNYLLITYTDNGRGIDLKKFGDRIFGMFQVFHEDKNGKGLGLYIVKRQIESLGGKIEVASTLGLGTTFKLYLKVK